MQESSIPEARPQESTGLRVSSLPRTCPSCASERGVTGGDRKGHPWWHSTCLSPRERDGQKAGVPAGLRGTLLCTRKPCTLQLHKRATTGATGSSRPPGWGQNTAAEDAEQKPSVFRGDAGTQLCHRLLRGNETSVPTEKEMPLDRRPPAGGSRGCLGDRRASCSGERTHCSPRAQGLEEPLSPSRTSHRTTSNSSAGGRGGPGGTRRHPGHK